ncbi:MAG: PQQ-binding-like beta-propeller repeat protein [Thermoplasmata archaeon]|nr:MAG: PQQ-binding-like beta-propeller repeat protein [Thermoplasmata archaeon]
MRISCLLVVIISIFIFFSCYPEVRSDSWPMLFNDSQNSGNTTSFAPDTNMTIWTRSTIGGDGYSSLAVANGRVFVNKGGGGILYCLSEGNGIEIWNRSIGFAGYGCATPAVSDGKVYVVSDKVYCFYENNGSEVWSKPISGGGTSSPKVANNRLYVNAQALYCYDANNGAEIWNKQVGGPGESTPAVANGKVFVNGQKLYCLNANNGNEIWNVSGGTSCSPVVANGKVFFNPGPIYCLFENNGSEIWSAPNGGDGYSSPAVGNGKVFVNVGGVIYCYDENDGTEMWYTSDIGDGCSTPAVSSDGKVIANGGGYTYCFDESNGNEVWKKYTGGPGFSSPAIANGRVFVNQRTVFCIGDTPLTIDEIVIVDGAQNELTTVFLNFSESMTIYAAGYNSSTSTFMGYVEVDWTESGGLGSFDPQTGSSTIFSAGTTLGVTTVFGENVGLGLIDDFVIEIISYPFLRYGWNLISIPEIQSDTSLTSVLLSIDGEYRIVQCYNSTDINDPWKHHEISKPPSLNDMNEINHKMGFWVYCSNPDGIIFTYDGTRPTQDQTITLEKGWNMVGYPSLGNKIRTEALNNLTFGDHVDAIWTYNSTAQKYEKIDESDFFEIGRGYYIHAKTKCEWEVPL